MNEVIKNTHAFVDILSMARGDAVQTWDEGTFSRAFKWAQYFEEVHRKLNTKPALAEKLNKYISNFNGSVLFGSLQLSFDQLGKSKAMLRNCLLQNPHISNAQFEHVIGLYGVKLGYPNDPANVDSLEQDVIKLTQQKGALTVLSQIRDTLTKNMKNETSINGQGELARTSDVCDREVGTFPQDYLKENSIGLLTSERLAIDAAGEQLFKHVHHLLICSESKDRESIYEKLKIISAQKHGMEIITSCLLFIPDDCQSHLNADSVQQFIVNWLQGSLSDDSNHLFWKLPTLLLSKLSFKYESILNFYLNRLTSWANKMAPVLTYQLSVEERWKLPKNQVYVWRSSERFSDAITPLKQMNNPDVDTLSGSSFESLVLHFKYLTSGPLYIQELCYKWIENLFSQNDKLEFPGETEQSDNIVVQRLSDNLGVNIWQDVYCSLQNNILKH